MQEEPGGAQSLMSRPALEEEKQWAWMRREVVLRRSWEWKWAPLLSSSSLPVQVILLLLEEVAHCVCAQREQGLHPCNTREGQTDERERERESK